MLRKASFVGMLVSGLILSVGCGDDDDDGGSTGLPKDKVVNDLTDDDAKKFCEWSEDLLNDFEPSAEDACAAYLALSTSTEEECEAQVDACVMVFEMPGSDPEEQDCAEATVSDIGDCTATVGEVETCYRDVFQSDKDFIEGTTCADAGDVQQPATPSSCTSIQSKCPGIFDDSDARIANGALLKNTRISRARLTDRLK